jgi:hypothetical protein
MVACASTLPPREFNGKISKMKKTKSAGPLRPHSSLLLDGDERAAARAMLYPVGFTKEDFAKPIIGIASTWSNVTPCRRRQGDHLQHHHDFRWHLDGQRRHEIFARLA